MTTQARPASARQLAYINRLRAEIGEPELTETRELTSLEASETIGALLARAHPNGAQRPGRRINEPRLGMAMKECFRMWTGLGWDVWKSKRQAFVAEVIRTYDLFTEIADTVEAESGTAGHGVPQRPTMAKSEVPGAVMGK